MTTATQPDVVDDELVDENSTRKQRREADVQARTEKLLKEATAAAMKRQSKDAKAAKKRGENFNPLTETAMRTSLESEVAKRAKREVHAEYRKQWAVEHAKAAGRSVKSDVITAVYRNRKQLAPWAMAAPFAVCGALGAGWASPCPWCPRRDDCCGWRWRVVVVDPRRRQATGPGARSRACPVPPARQARRSARSAVRGTGFADYLVHAEHRRRLVHPRGRYRGAGPAVVEERRTHHPAEARRGHPRARAGAGIRTGAGPAGRAAPADHGHPDCVGEPRGHLCGSRIDDHSA
ncbi:hypothetical protein JD82_04920 [Prauserella rugosa]|uniref:Uncharacterized protein n=1 Tax=Prauserella rugosa TaxID=43354 RepID=A0A660C441_9PSEU|nr:hypothetical protein JD82_04920 [Prauserella rugosa]